MRVEEHSTTVDDVPVFYRSAHPVAAGGVVPVYLHEAITSSADWTALLERTGGLAPDLIGFGRTGKGGHLDLSPQGIASFVADLLSVLATGPVTVVGHGWGGAVALLLGLQQPRRVERLVLINPVPLLPGFRWHRAARLWRRPLIGELMMGLTSRRMLSRQLRKGTARADAWSEQRLEEIWAAFDQGTQRAMLRLHRAADEPALAELGASLGSLGMPALVLWGERDPWFAPRFADAYGEALPDCTVERVAGAGHWPWLDEPRVLELIASFVEQRR